MYLGKVHKEAIKSTMKIFGIYIYIYIAGRGKFESTKFLLACAEGRNHMRDVSVVK